MIPTRLVGSALLAFGLVLLLFGLDATASPLEQVYAGLTPGDAPDGAWSVASGLTVATAGLLLSFSPSR